MPIYEYRCNDCGKKFAFLYGVSAYSRSLCCPYCEGINLSRLISRVARLRSEEDRLEALADPGKIGDWEDPRQIRRWARQMGSALSDEAGEDLSEVVDEMLESEQQGEGDTLEEKE
ncbi:MAG: zinc ribbon domain-containing protein [Nitrospinota bacterium]|nr:MAG: zinc ribbon domain-containing protein [Nitrospinota bacterium]